jgi:hypothetical protein
MSFIRYCVSEKTKIVRVFTKKTLNLTTFTKNKFKTIKKELVYFNNKYKYKNEF